MPETKKRYGFGNGPIDYEAKLEALRENPPSDMISEEQMKENLEKTGWFNPELIFDRIPADSATAKLLAEPLGADNDDPLEIPSWPSDELGPSPFSIDMERAQRTLDNWDDYDEDEKIDVLLDVAKAYNENELALGRRLVYRSVRELDDRPGNTWLRSMTGYVAQMLHMNIDIAREFDEEIDNLANKLSKHMLTDDEAPELTDPKVLWQVMPPHLQWKHPLARPPPFDKEPEWPAEFQKKESPLKVNPEDIWKVDLEAVLNGKDQASAHNATSTNAPSGPSTNATVGGVTTSRTSVPNIQKPKGDSTLQPKRRRVVRLDEAPPAPQHQTTTRKLQGSSGDRPVKKKKYTIVDLFGDKLNALENDQQGKALLETFISKKTRPKDAPDRIKIHEETNFDPATGTTIITSLSVILDWEKHSFKKVRNKKKVEPPAPAPETQPPVPAAIVQKPLVKNIAPPVPTAPAQSSGIPELAFADDDDDDD